METVGIVLRVLMPLILVAMLTLGTVSEVRRRGLGERLWHSPGENRWLAGIYFLLGVGGGVMDWAKAADKSMLIVSKLLWVGVGLFWLIRARFSIHTKGLVLGLAVVRWEELEGWGRDPMKGTVLIWSRSNWVRALLQRPVNESSTGQSMTPEIEELLDRYAAASKRYMQLNK